MDVQHFVELVKQKYPNEIIPTEIPTKKRKISPTKASPNKKVKKPTQLDIPLEDYKTRWVKIQLQLSEMYCNLYKRYPKLQF